MLSCILFISEYAHNIDCRHILILPLHGGLHLDVFPWWSDCLCHTCPRESHFQRFCSHVAVFKPLFLFIAFHFSLFPLAGTFSHLCIYCCCGIFVIIMYHCFIFSIFTWQSCIPHCHVLDCLPLKPMIYNCSLPFPIYLSLSHTTSSVLTVAFPLYRYPVSIQEDRRRGLGAVPFTFRNHLYLYSNHNYSHFSNAVLYIAQLTFLCAFLNSMCTAVYFIRPFLGLNCHIPVESLIQTHHSYVQGSLQW